MGGASVPFRSPGTAGPEPASGGDATREPSGRSGTPRAAHHEPAATESMAAAEADVLGGEHGLTDREKQELRNIADAANPGRTIMAGRPPTKGPADRDSAGTWCPTDS